MNYLVFGLVVVFLVSGCVGSQEWEKRIDAAMAESECVVLEKPDYPESYYKGPLIDTHLHIPQLPDDFGGEIDWDYDEPRGVDADLYDAIAEEDVPLLGRNVTIDDIACTLKNEGTIKAFSFFPVYSDIPVPLVEVAYRTNQKYPELFFPFISTPGRDISTVEAEIVVKMLNIKPGLFKGYGEVGDSPTEPINPAPDAQIYLDNFQVAKENNLLVYFHPGEGQEKNLERALQKYPDVIFIVHADAIEPHIGDLIERYPNIYYTVNNFFEEHIPLFRFGDKQDFIDAVERDWDELMENDLERFKELIEKNPDRYMWGTDRSDIVWNYDQDVSQILTKYGREFISKLDSSVQEKYAYKNAENLIEKTR